MRHSAHKVCLESEKRVVRHERVRHKDRLLPANSTCVRQSDITIVNCSGTKEEIWLFARLCTNFTGYVVQSSGWSKTVYIYIYTHICTYVFPSKRECCPEKALYCILVSSLLLSSPCAGSGAPSPHQQRPVPICFSCRPWQP